MKVSPLKKVNLNSHNPLLIQINNVVDITEAQGLCGRTHGGKVCECPSRNWGSSWKKIGREGFRQGICCPRTVSGTEER